MKQYLLQLKWWLIYLLLNSKERSIFLSNLKGCRDGLEKYSDCMGETYQEYVEEVNKIPNNIRIFTSNKINSYEKI